MSGSTEPPLLLIAGTALQMVAWADGPRAELAARRFTAPPAPGRREG